MKRRGKRRRKRREGKEREKEGQEGGRGGEIKKRAIYFNLSRPREAAVRLFPLRIPFIKRERGKGGIVKKGERREMERGKKGNSKGRGEGGKEKRKREGIVKKGERREMEREKRE